jgi:tyrosine-specific transport protein
MTDRSFFSKVLSGSLLVAGTAIGAGMLGIPAVTAQAGFWPGLMITTVVWLFMVMTGLILLEVTFWMKERASFLSIAERFLGKKGKFVTGILFTFLYFAFMIAYFAAGVPLLSDFINALFPVHLHGFVSYLLFGTVFGLIVGIGPKSIDRANLILTIFMCFFWIVLIAIGSKYVTVNHLRTKSILAAWWATPVLFGAFGYHNIIPSLSTYFQHDKKVLRYSIWIGTFIPYLVYSFWQWLIIGAVGKTKILATVSLGLPITYALKAITHNPHVLVFGQIFAFLAIVTSTLGVAFSLVDFLADGLRKKPVGLLRWGLTAIIFVVPMAFAYLDPTIFEKALGLAGGYGEAFLNGLLPICVYAIGRYVMRLNGKTLNFKKFDLGLLTVFCLVVVVLETILLITKN